MAVVRWTSLASADSSLHPSFDVDVHVNVFPKHLVKTGHPEIRTLQGGGGFPAGKLGAGAHAGTKSEGSHLEHNFLGHALECEVAGDIKSSFTSFLP